MVSLRCWLSRYVANYRFSSAGVNYGELTNTLLIFDAAKSSHTVPISINKTDETNLEVDEVFIVSLSFPESGELTPQDSMTLEPNNATVAIFEIIGGS